MSFRFLHTADLHLDAPLKAVAFRDPELAAQIGIASRQAFTRLIDLCLEEEVDFLLIAGDLWDGTYSSTKTPRFLKQELLRLAAAGIRCFIIRGNHDAMARQTGELEAPATTHIFGHKPETVDFELRGQWISIHGLSFKDPHAPESLLPRYPAAKPGAFNIGMMHTSLNGSAGHDNYAPTSVSALDGHGYHYWALGHIHRRSEHIGQSTIVMPGIPQGRDIGEAGRTSVTLVEVDSSMTLRVSQRNVAPIRFERLDIDCAGLEDWSALLQHLERSLTEIAQQERSEDYLVLRPRLTGASPLAWRAARDLDRLTEEARSFTAGSGLMIDKLELGLTMPSEGAAQSALPEELLTLLFETLPNDPGLTEAMAAATRELAQALPPEARNALYADEAEIAPLCRSLLAEGLPGVLDRLTATEKGQ